MKKFKELYNQVKNIFKKHPIIWFCIVILALLILIRLLFGPVYPSDWYNLFVATFFVLVVYIFVDSQLSRKIEKISKIEQDIDKNIQGLMITNTQIKDNIKKAERSTQKLITANFQIDSNIKKTEKDIQNLMKANLQINNNIKQTNFQLEKRATVYKYPESEEYNKVNGVYRPFMSALFKDENPIIGIIIDPEYPKKDLFYKIEVVRNEDNTPKKVTILYSTFYIIKIISPYYMENSTKEEKRNKYKDSPIKEGEYYGCRFSKIERDEFSWFLGQQLSFGLNKDGFYKFYYAGSDIIGGVIPSANQVMGHIT